MSGLRKAEHRQLPWNPTKTAAREVKADLLGVLKGSYAEWKGRTESIATADLLEGPTPGPQQPKLVLPKAIAGSKELRESLDQAFEQLVRTANTPHPDGETFISSSAALIRVRNSDDQKTLGYLLVGTYDFDGGGSVRDALGFGLHGEQLFAASASEGDQFKEWSRAASEAAVPKASHRAVDYSSSLED